MTGIHEIQDPVVAATMPVDPLTGEKQPRLPNTAAKRPLLKRRPHDKKTTAKHDASGRDDE